jgi:hypothetical protein
MRTSATAERILLGASQPQRAFDLIGAVPPSIAAGPPVTVIAACVRL